MHYVIIRLINITCYYVDQDIGGVAISINLKVSCEGTLKGELTSAKSIH